MADRTARPKQFIFASGEISKLVPSRMIEESFERSIEQIGRIGPAQIEEFEPNAGAFLAIFDQQVFEELPCASNLFGLLQSPP